jgi:threonine/homoserine/homoserine lactone efflux protein
MTLEHWLIYLIAAIGLSLAPGPNGLLSITHGACFGFRPTLYTILGGAVGFLLLITISLAGFGTLMATSEQVFTLVKWIGAGYLIYLGFRVWQSPPPNFRGASLALGNAQAIPSRMFQQGFLVAVSNPKGILFFAAFLPQFMVADASFLMQLFVLGGTFILVETIYELLLASFAQRISPWLSRYGRLFNRTTGGIFVAMGTVLATASR